MPMTDEELRFTYEYGVALELVTRRGGERIVAGPPMDEMIKEIARALIDARAAALEEARAAAMGATDG